MNIGWSINKVCGGGSENEWIPADICGDLYHQEEEELSWWPARAVGPGPWWQQWELLLITESPAFLALHQEGSIGLWAWACRSSRLSVSCLSFWFLVPRSKISQFVRWSFHFNIIVRLTIVKGRPKETPIAWITRLGQIDPKQKVTAPSLNSACRRLHIAAVPTLCSQ